MTSNNQSTRPDTQTDKSHALNAEVKIILPATANIHSQKINTSTNKTATKHPTNTDNTRITTDKIIIIITTDDHIIITTAATTIDIIITITTTQDTTITVTDIITITPEINTGYHGIHLSIINTCRHHLQQTSKTEHGTIRSRNSHNSIIISCHQ